MSNFLPVDKAKFHKENQTNKTGFIGVTFKKLHNSFYAYIRGPGRKNKIYCGCGKTAEEAARKYDIKAIELFGKEAVTNFPGETDHA